MIHYDQIVVGGGFGGMTTLHKLREKGYNVHGFERGSDFGGVWHHNRYPGARVDSETPVYQLWLKEVLSDFIFTQRFPDWKELQRYFKYAGQKLKLYDYFTMNTEVTSSHWNDEENLWYVSTQSNLTGDEQQFTCNHLVLCIGFAAKKTYPDLKGRDSFKGTSFHTADWPWEGIDVKGKKVAVIGTGASGVQVIQSISKEVGELVVFQRTPNLVLPMQSQEANISKQKERKEAYHQIFNDSIPSSFSGFEFEPDTRWGKDCTPEEIKEKFDECWNNGGFRFWLGNFSDIMVDKSTNRAAWDYWKEKSSVRVKDPRKRKILVPDEPPHYIFTKRPCLETTYFESYNRDNVDIVDININSITEVTENGLVTKDGSSYEFDIIIYATGFDAITGGFYQMDLKGKNGITISEAWENGTYTYLGMGISQFPNLYFLYGPQGPTAFCNGPTCALIQGVWISELIDFTTKHGFKYNTPSLEAQNTWKKYIQDNANLTLLPYTRSWYMGANREGNKPRECLLYVRGVGNYYKDINKESDSGYPNFIFVK
ncbi:cyclopentanone 1,2-monooxygenase [Scheffersomyces xylosifermentans]|uniref:cyclopentanone 1,2-monooxygenase n=1 Tax=Scheffersomyces xylosifermentans TaxID=1304137 RepID=UPI00315C9D41